MNLKRQLLMVSVLTLILPWAGCQFIRETESALREGQQQMLSGTAQAIADSLSQFPDELMLGSENNVPGATQLYGQPLLSAPLIDGYLDDWSVADDATATLRGTDGDIAYVIGTFRQYIFLHLDVRDSSIVFARNREVDGRNFADEIALVSDNGFAEKTVFRFRAEGPGQIVATRHTGNQVADETRIEAFWQDTASGYRLEARIPRGLIGETVGLVVTNTTGPNDQGVRSATFNSVLPGRFVTVSPLLQSVASGYVQPGLRLMVTNTDGWRLALAGNVSGSSIDEADGDVGKGWLRLIYSVLLAPGDEAALAAPDPSGREQLSYIAEALEGQPATRWFRSPDTGRAVVSVAHPIWSGTVQTGAIVLQQGTDAILSLTNQALTRLITLTLTATVVVALVLLGYASWLSSRIRNLSNAAERALDEKHVQAALPSALAGDEVGDLSRSFSSVLRQLGNYNDYLQTLASKLSHELRTPLTIVRSSLENLEHETLSADAVTYTTRAKEGVDRLGAVLNAMSEANRIEELIDNIDAEIFDVAAIIASTVAAYGDAWPDRQFVFRNDSAGTNILGSPELIIQMLDKLADNAVDFSKRGDAIEISTSREEDDLVLSVMNPGPSLPEDMATQMFNSMVSVRPGDGGKHLGLGLHIARLIVEGHGGSIHAENTDDGVVFQVRLPVNRTT